MFNNLRRFKFVILITALVFSVLVIRITKLMFFNKDIILASPQTKNLQERGFILDRNGDKLALSIETYSIYARPAEVENKLETSKRLSAILGIDYREILNQLNRKRPFVWIKRQVDLSKIHNIEGLSIKGVYLEKEFRRYYPFHHLASHILGFVGIDNKGLEGIEYYFDSYLNPKRIDKKKIDLIGQSRGYSVVLTIDRYIQGVVEEALEKALKDTGAKLVTAIVMRPSTGEILALANKPDFDPNYFKKFPKNYIRNRAITDSFEPGSTFKIFIASLLLDRNLISPSDRFVCKGYIKIGNTTIHDTAKHGIIDFREVLQKSCNVGMILSVDRIDDNELYKGLRNFGFGTPTGINLAGESSGILRTPNRWSRISKYEIAIGQEVAVTSLQLITAGSAIANNGVLMQPRIIKKLENPDGTVLKEFKPLKIRRVIRKETAENLLKILTGVLTKEGTGYKARIEGYNIAGKTGTAQIADVKNGGYLENQFYASFIGFVPVPNPEIAVLVTIDRPKGEKYGGQTAAPVFKYIVERIAPYLNILPNNSTVYVVHNEYHNE